MRIVDNCPYCGGPVPRSAETCPHCARPGRYPNVLDAEDPKEARPLDRRHKAAVKEATEQGATDALDMLEALMASTQVVISRPQSIIHQLSMGDDVVYATYYHLLDSGLRIAVDDEWDRPRQMADITLFTNYYRNIRFGCLSTDGTGLPNYGDFFLELREDFIAHRCSVFEENAVVFLLKREFQGYDHKKKVSRGYRAPWADRHKVGVAKLARRLGKTTNEETVRNRILAPGSIGDRDKFIEAHVYGPITRRTMRRVMYRPSGKKRRRTARKDDILDKIREGLEQADVEIEGF